MSVSDKSSNHSRKSTAKNPNAKGKTASARKAPAIVVVQGNAPRTEEGDIVMEEQFAKPKKTARKTPTPVAVAKECQEHTPVGSVTSGSGGSRKRLPAVLTDHGTPVKRARKASLNVSQITYGCSPMMKEKSA